MSARAEKRFLAGQGSAPRATKIAETLYKIPALLTIWTRCGKPNCRCAAGHLHGPYHALHWREGAVQRRRYVRQRDVPAVQAIVARRQQQRLRERLELLVSRMTWRQLARLLEEREAALRDEEPRR